MSDRVTEGQRPLTTRGGSPLTKGAQPMSNAPTSNGPPPKTPPASAPSSARPSSAA
jgi:hypothetical protein